MFKCPIKYMKRSANNLERLILQGGFMWRNRGKVLEWCEYVSDCEISCTLSVYLTYQKF